VVLAGLAVAPSSGAQTSTTEGGSSPDALPSCRGRAGGLDLDRTLPFSDVARSFVAEDDGEADGGGGGGDEAEIVAYELFCPYGERPAGATDDTPAALELTLQWAVAPVESGPGCTEDQEAAVGGGAAGIVADPDRRAQVDWATTEDGPDEEAAVQAADNLLGNAPEDTVDCEAEASSGSTAPSSAEDDGDDGITTPAIVILAAALVGLLALAINAVRRRTGTGKGKSKGQGKSKGKGKSEPLAVPPAPEDQPSVPAGASAGSPPLFAEAPAAEHGDLGSTSTEPSAPLAALRAAPPAVRSSPAGALLTVAEAGRLMAAQDRTWAASFRQAGRAADEVDQLLALADALDALAQGSARQAAVLARSGGSGPTRGQVDALLTEVTRLLDTHRPPDESAPA